MICYGYSLIQRNCRLISLSLKTKGAARGGDATERRTSQEGRRSSGKKIGSRKW